MEENPLDLYLPEPIRSRIEQDYYARVNAQARLEQAIHDPDFLQQGTRHVALFSDHGVVHVRDVARQILQVLKAINGVLIPARDQTRMDSFMHGYGVMAAYLHDIGMADFSAMGRAMHPEFAARAVFTSALDEVIEMMWAANCGHVAGRLTSLAGAGALDQDPKTVFRELLSLCVCHSKSKVPVAALNDPAALRSKMQAILNTDLRLLHRQQMANGGAIVEAASPAVVPPPPALPRYYNNFVGESFGWLIADQPEAGELVDDVIDTLRALRCADALRQRGAVQKTSGGYEIFVSQKTGNAVYALRYGEDKLYLLEIANDLLSAGEVNIASSELSPDGNLRLSFHRGAFATDAATRRAAYCAAYTVHDIQADVIDSFHRADQPDPNRSGPLKAADDIQILLESTDDNPAFVELIREGLRQLNPAIAPRMQLVPSLQSASELERTRYLEAGELNWALSRRQEVLNQIARSGHKTEAIDLVEGFKQVKRVTLQAGETLIKAESPASFVYVPLGDGLKVMPLGGYAPFSVKAWMPLGNTGVIRGAIRNAEVVADQEVSLLIIPKEVYLWHWHHPYTSEELKQSLAKDVPLDPA